MTMSRGMLPLLGLCTCASAASKPHVLFVLADDYGWNDVGYHQNSVSSANPDGKNTTHDVIATPNIDALASEALKLEMYYVQPLCSPTRSTIQTGRYPSQTGIGPNVIKPTKPYGVPSDEFFMPEGFKAAGYATHIVGKWHLGLCDERFTPTFRGYDTFFGYLLGAEDYFQHTRSDSGFTGLDLRNSTTLISAAGKLPPVVTTAGGNYSTFLFARQVDNLVKAHNPSIPLFLYLPFQAVHGPLEAPDSYIAKYANIQDKSRRKYAGMVSALDDAVGQVVQSFRDAGLWDNTLLVFSTDNGGPLGSANNYPLRGHKATAWEGGVRGVGFVRGTDSDLAKVPAGGVSHELMHATDWLPTLAEVAGFSLDKTRPLSGVSQWQMISQGAKSTRKVLIHNSPAAGKPNGRGGAIRVGDYKLMFTEDSSLQVKGNTPQTPPPGFNSSELNCPIPEAVNGTFLFNVKDDPRECTNLAATKTDIVAKLTKQFDDYTETAVADLSLSFSEDPEANPSKDPSKAWGPWADRSTKCKF
eukprot:Hpha_TRINITY_DN15933_c0_g1::TRINITY_DN15933_c0_g1_i1::g.72909::m.72909/K01135/ARSB; arylsulfatase B